ncbi:MAG: hypothetical protein ABIO67_05490 [Mycobacteriales bacterium]
MTLQRLVIFGAPGSGKTTLAIRLCKSLGHCHVERDSLGSLGSKAYVEAAHEAVQASRWIFDGPPYFVDAEVYGRADTVIILDFPRTLVTWRVLYRSLRPAVGGRGKRPEASLIRDHPLWVVLTQFRARRIEGAGLEARSDVRGKDLLRFSDPTDLERWVLTHEQP